MNKTTKERKNIPPNVDFNFQRGSKGGRVVPSIPSLLVRSSPFSRGGKTKEIRPLFPSWDGIGYYEGDILARGGLYQKTWNRR